MYGVQKRKRPITSEGGGGGGGRGGGGGGGGGGARNLDFPFEWRDGGKIRSLIKIQSDSLFCKRTAWPGPHIMNLKWPG